ncbi:hypothetical protein QZH41_018733 [Actinostola sp. cb2023]|nr:hypothetical protein QZH41_018733 [Actinostola sp. cb2023]
MYMSLLYKTFTGNTDYERVVRHVISPVMWARYVRFMARTWNSHISMRVEVHSFGRASPTDLGIDFTKKEIPDKQITASSYHTSSHRPEMGRLNYPFNFLSWCPKDLYGNHWLQFDFGHAMLVTSIVTQGRGDADRRWLTEYKISYSLDNVAWTYYRKDVTSPVKVGPLGTPVLANQDSPSNIIAYQHDDVTLHCEAVGDWPMTFTWSFQGHVIESVNDSQLVLTNVTKANEGFYACNATNALGTNRKILHLEMKDSIGVCIRYKSFFGDIPLTSTSTTHLNDTISFNENDWYVFYGKRGYYRMPTKCVPQNYCSTEATGHMTGTLPTVNQGIVKRKGSHAGCFHHIQHPLPYTITSFIGPYNTIFNVASTENPGRMFSSSPTSLALHHHVIHRFFDITDGLDCMRCCTVDTACKTYNFSPNRATCELNNATADGEFAGHLKRRPEFNYYREAGLIQSLGHDEL